MTVSLIDMNPYLHGRFGPVKNEVTALDLPVIGEIPRDLHGAYYRNGPNPRVMPEGMHHWFDGDGMLHAIYFEDGRAEYRNRYVRTRDMMAEDAGQSDVGGIFYPANEAHGDTVYKDTANTDVVLHHGELMALWYVSGKPVRVHPRTLETIRTENFGGRLPRNVSAHSKADYATGEFVFFDYALFEPWMSFGVVSPDNELQHFSQVELPGPRLPHDMGLTENYIILHDLPVVLTGQGLRKRLWTIHQPRELPARFGIVPRRGDGASIKWFETEHCYIYHVINAWEDGDEVVMQACRMVDNGFDPSAGKYGPYAPMVAVLALHAVPCEWRFNMKTGQSSVRQLDDRIGEFPVVNLDYAGRKARYSYHTSFDTKSDLQSMDGLLKYDLDSGACVAQMFEPGVYGSEPAFAPRTGAQGEDDGYVIVFVTDANSLTSEARIYDARNMDRAPLARIALPQKVPAGFHGTWAPAPRMKMA